MGHCQGEFSIRLQGVPYVFEITNDGIRIRRKGTRRSLDIPWEKIGKVAQLPDRAPAKCLADPLGYVCADS